MKGTSDPWSAPITTLYDTIREVLADERPAAIATIVDVQGSAYRRTGAKMVIEPNREALGAITAGCLEGPVIDIASDVIESGDRHLETYDLTDDDEWGLGMGCNGVIDVLVEPLDESWHRPVTTLSSGAPVVLVSVLETTDESIPSTARAAITPDGDVSSVSGRPEIPSGVLASVDIDPYLDGGHAETVTLETDGGTVRVFVDALVPPPELLVFGWQRDVHPVVQFASEVGFRVTVASGRGGKADEDAFPAADRVVSTRPSELAEQLDAPERTYAVLMSHNFLDDRLAIESLLETPIPYVGLMGPRKRFDELRADIVADGDHLSAAELERIATPVGLDLGAGEPAQIAMAIVAEVLAVKNGRTGGRLATADGPIHPRPVADDR